MEPIWTVGTILAALATVGGAIQTYRSLITTREAEVRFARLLRDRRLRDRLLDELTKKDVGDQTLSQIQADVNRLLLELPKQQRRLLASGLYQPSVRGRRDFLLKLATEPETGNASNPPQRH